MTRVFLCDGPASGQIKGSKKKFDTVLDFCVSSLRRGHANLLCIVPILTVVLFRGTKVASRNIDLVPFITPAISDYRLESH